MQISPHLSKLISKKILINFKAKGLHNPKILFGYVKALFDIVWKEAKWDAWKKLKIIRRIVEVGASRYSGEGTLENFD